MTISFHLPEQLPKITVVIRSTGERSFQACKALLLKQIPENCVHVVSEMPFESTLKKTYKIGLESDDEWLMTLDADVLLREGAILDLLSASEDLSARYFQLEGLVHDKLFGLYRNAGHRMYRTKYLNIALQHIPPEKAEIRPEYTTLQKMTAMGYPSIRINTVFGVHDYEQFLRDIYRKAFIHANKHQIWLPQLINRWKTLGVVDDDFRIALRGLYDGLITTNKVRVDKRDYLEAAEQAMHDFGFQEKPFLEPENIDYNYVEAILADAGEIMNKIKPHSFEAKLERLKGRFAQFGLVRIAPYLLGAMLCDIGNKLKNLVEDSKRG